MDDMSRTIDLTPTWETAAAIYLAVLDNPSASAEGRDVARTEIMRLARAFDAAQPEPDLAP